MKLRKILVLTDNKQIKAYVHPTRINILTMLAAKKMTVSSVAKKLKVHPANITHHFRLLERKENAENRIICFSWDLPVHLTGCSIASLFEDEGNY